MLLEIFISNFVLIENLRISFGRGLNVLTGETGAGKSIIIDALGLILGERVQKDLIRDSRFKAMAEAVFDINKLEVLRQELQEQGLLEQGEITLVLCREIIPGGKSLSRINGRTITAAQLKRIAAHLLDMHLQHDHLSILRPEMYLTYIDGFNPDAMQLAQQVRACYGKIKALQQVMAAHESDQQGRLQRLDFLSYQIQEIQAAHLHPEEEEELQVLRNRIRDAEKLTAGIEQVLQYLYNQEQGRNAYDLISRSMGIMASLESDPVVSKVHDSVKEIYYALEEMASELSTYRNTLEFDTDALERAENRLHQIGKLKSRYGKDIGEILQFLEQAEREYDSLQNSQAYQVDLQEQMNVVQAEYDSLAGQLSQMRQLGAVEMEQRVQEELAELNMPNLVFRVQLIPGPAGPGGTEQAEWLFSANPGEEPRPVHRIASGGEISRFVLALKIVLAGIYHVPTLIFDEIDAGVGGTALAAMASKIAQLAQSYQVILVTHAPQIASQARHHHLISKAFRNGKTHTSVMEMDQAARITEIARMLGGENFSAVTLEHAREMVRQGQEKWTEQ